MAKNIAVRIFSETGDELTKAPVVLPISTSIEQLQSLCNKLLEYEESIPISFRTEEGKDINESLGQSLANSDSSIFEKGLTIVYLPQAVFKVTPVTRCTASIPGHTEPVISVAFSPDGSQLASGSGDKTVRLWDLQTELPEKTLEGHLHWVLCISWSPNGKKLASACKLGKICLWDLISGKQLGKALSGHKDWINALAWEPLHIDPNSRLLASASRDSTIRIWDTTLHNTTIILSGHSASVTCIRWGGCGLIYSGSHDRSIKVWRSSDGVLCKTLIGHGHWINSMALSVDYVLRTGCYALGESREKQRSPEEMQTLAKSLYEQVARNKPEKLVSGSDDFTMYLWEPAEKKQPSARMTGHQQPINHVLFSPDARIIASASFDKSIKLWDNQGQFICTLHGHVQAVYQIAWSPDSRLLVSGSADSTLKVWEVGKRKLLLDLPGHGSDVFAVDWSPDGERVASGGKDCLIKLWRR